MNKARVQITTDAMLLFFLMASLITGTGPTVTCFGEDGHVKEEVAPANCCDQSPGIPFQVSRSSYTDATYVVASTSSCGSCIDIPTLVNNYISKLTPAQKKLTSLKLVPGTTTLISNNVTSHEESIAKPENPVNYTLASIRTTVLII